MSSTLELLAPAGNPEALDAAVGEGADAVYLGLRSFNARMRSVNFAYNQFEAAVDALHRQARKIYVTVNTVFEDREADRMYQFLQYLNRVGPDGIIIQDFGVAQMAREHFPSLRLHASTQMNVSSAYGANQLSRFGFKRVVLARELSLEEIASVRRGSNLELETFVHGALCVSVSGLCLFSSWLGGKSANRGGCTQACRRLYAEERGSGYYFSPDDLELVGRIPDLAEAGVSTLKIEGRMKSSEYVGTVVAAYRYMIDNYRLDPERALSKARVLLKNDFARRKTSYWFDGTAAPGFIRPDQAGGTGIALGKVREVRTFANREGRWALIQTFEGLAEGDSVRIHRADDSGRETGKVREVLEKPEGMYLRLELPFRQTDQVYLIQTRSMARRYRSVLPSNLERYRRAPGFDQAPRVEFSIPSRGPRHSSEAARRDDAFPPGLYALVGRVTDLHVLQAARPVMAALRFNRITAADLRASEGSIPFKRDTLALWLDPFFPEGDAVWLDGELDYWISRGQRRFVANNLGHVNLLKSRGVEVAAGPWLYAYNSRAAVFLFENGVECLIPPLEISKQALRDVYKVVPPRALMPVVFSFPPLFTMRSDLYREYGFRHFSDREDTGYELVRDGTGSAVIPSVPLSLTDRVPFLKREGCERFLLDFGHMEPSKPMYRQVFRAASEGTVLPETGRFNWKSGFWNPGEESTARGGHDAVIVSGPPDGQKNRQQRGPRERPRDGPSVARGSRGPRPPGRGPRPPGRGPRPPGRGPSRSG
ncbi:MAG TPA: U32 family peptidase [Magnetospirillaceae bacterium]|nr:U32 family peptidase [Magnetospirillaceae bacterium]